MQHRTGQTGSTNRDSHWVDPPKPSVPRVELPPGPSEQPVVGQAHRLRGDFIGLLREAATYGDISTASVNPITICLTNHPELNRDVLVKHHRVVSRGQTTFRVFRWLMGNSITTSNVAEHLVQRRLMQPQFQRRHIENYGQAMTDIAARQAEAWADGAAVDMHQEMRKLALQVIVKVLFGADQSEMVDRLGEAFAKANDYLYLRLTQPPALRGLLHELPIPSSRRFRRKKAFVDGVVYRMIKERRESAEDFVDLLALLLQARYEGEDGEEAGGLSDEEVRDQIVSLYFAGHDSTAASLAWTFCLLSENPEVEARLHTELDQVLGGLPATIADLPNLKLTDQIITEGLRLYPPLWGLGRMTYESVSIGGFQIPPGITMMSCPVVTQRDPRWFEQPDEFRPERWTEKCKRELPRFAYFPFGGGPHQCIGEGIAWMQMKITLATLCQAWQFRRDPSHKPEMLPRITLVPKGGMPGTLVRRSQSSKASRGQ